MKEFFESLFDTLKTRYRNKFIGTFVLVYLGLNWEKIAVFFFISDFKYQEFIDIWTDDGSVFWTRVFLAVGISIVYLIVSPWVSLFIHMAQSKAITEYKLKSVENEMIFISKKQKMEIEKQNLLELEKKNVESTAEIKELKDQNEIENPDKLIFKKITSILSEKDIKQYILDVTDSRMGIEFKRSLMQLCSEISTVENKYKNKTVQECANLLEKSCLDALDFMESSRVFSSRSTITNATIQEYTKILNDLLIKYRNFYEAGIKL